MPGRIDIAGCPLHGSLAPKPVGYPAQCIIVRDKRQLDAAMLLKPAIVKATSRLSMPTGNGNDKSAIGWVYCGCAPPWLSIVWRTE